MHNTIIKYFPVNPCEGVSVVLTFCQSRVGKRPLPKGGTVWFM